MFPANFLDAERIICCSPAASKKRILEEIGSLLSSASPGISPTKVFDKLLERERLGSTGLGQGIALPHARIAGVDHACGALIQLQAGVDFDAIDDQPVDLVFGLMVPEEATQEHLQLLARLATLFSDDEFCGRLRAMQDSHAVLKLLLDAEEPARS